MKCKTCGRPLIHRIINGKYAWRHQILMLNGRKPKCSKAVPDRK